MPRQGRGHRRVALGREVTGRHRHVRYIAQVPAAAGQESGQDHEAEERLEFDLYVAQVWAAGCARSRVPSVTPSPNHAPPSWPTDEMWHKKIVTDAAEDRARVGGMWWCNSGEPRGQGRCARLTPPPLPPPFARPVAQDDTTAAAEGRIPSPRQHFGEFIEYFLLTKFGLPSLRDACVPRRRAPWVARPGPLLCASWHSRDDVRACVRVYHVCAGTCTPSLML